MKISIFVALLMKTTKAFSGLQPYCKLTTKVMQMNRVKLYE